MAILEKENKEQHSIEIVNSVVATSKDSETPHCKISITMLCSLKGSKCEIVNRLIDMHCTDSLIAKNHLQNNLLKHA